MAEAILNIASFVIVVGSSFMLGKSYAMIRWHRRMAEGWRYLHITGNRRAMAWIDIIIAFSIDDTYQRVRREALDEHDAAL